MHIFLSFSVERIEINIFMFTLLDFGLEVLSMVFHRLSTSKTQSVSTSVSENFTVKANTSKKSDTI